MIASSARNEFFMGVREMVPLTIGAIPFGIIFGIISHTADIPWWAAQGMSAFVFAGSSQFIASSLILAGTPYVLIVLTTFIVNLRHALYGASVAEYMTRLPKRWKAFLAYGMTDESFATTIVHYRDANISNENKHWYFLGANLGMFIPWQIDTAIGYSIGSAIGDPLALGLDFAMSAVFIAILIPQIRARADVLSALSAGVLAVMLYSLPSKLGLLIAIVVGILVGLGVETWNSRS